VSWPIFGIYYLGTAALLWSIYEASGSLLYQWFAFVGSTAVWAGLAYQASRSRPLAVDQPLAPARRRVVMASLTAGCVLTFALASMRLGPGWRAGSSSGSRRAGESDLPAHGSWSGGGLTSFSRYATGNRQTPFGPSLHSGV
jgi:hypothetical protein